MYYVYLLECADKTFYCGYTVDIEKRLDHHNNSKLGAKYTSGRRPVALVYSEVFQTLSEALKREYQIKKMDRKAKKFLAKSMIV